jgi:hypothetical protein
VSIELQALQLQKQALMTEIDKSLLIAGQNETSIQASLIKKAQLEQQINSARREVEETEYRLWDLKDLLNDQIHVLLDDVLTEHHDSFELISKDCEHNPLSDFCAHVTLIYDAISAQITWTTQGGEPVGVEINAETYNNWLEESQQVQSKIAAAFDAQSKKGSQETEQNNRTVKQDTLSTKQGLSDKQQVIQREVSLYNALDTDLKEAQLALLERFTSVWRSILDVSADKSTVGIEDESYLPLREKIDLISLEQAALNDEKDRIQELSQELVGLDRQLVNDTSSEIELSTKIADLEQIEAQVTQIMSTASTGDNSDVVKRANEWRLLRLNLIKKISDYNDLSGTSIINRELTKNTSIVAQAQALVSELPEYEWISPSVLKQLKRLTTDYIGVLQQINLQHKIRLVNGSESLKRLSLKERTPGESLSVYIDSTKSTSILMDDVRLTVPTEDFIPGTLSLFPMVLIANDKGEVVANKQSLKNSASVADLRFTSVLSILKRQEESIPKTIPKQSEQFELSIGGIDYRLFIQPLILPHHLGYSEPLALIGITPVSDLRLAKLSIFPTTAMWMLLLLLILLTLVPILKVRFVSPKHHFSSADVTQTGFALVMLMGVLSIALG